MLNLASSFRGRLTPMSEVSDTHGLWAGPHPRTYNVVWTNDDGPGLDPRLTLGRFNQTQDSHSFGATLLEPLPTTEKLKSLRTTNEFIELLGAPRQLSDGWTNRWEVFSIKSDQEIEVIYVKWSTISDSFDIYRGILKTMD